MVLNIASLFLVLGITFMHSIFGLYSGIINTLCCIIAAVVSLGCFEPLNAMVVKEFALHPSFTEPICLVLLFVVTLTILRVAADNLLRGNVKMPLYVDWGGGAVCGFVMGQICVGMLVISFLMLPFGERALMFSRYVRTDERDAEHRLLAQFERRTIWLDPDGFTLGLVNRLSGGSLKGHTTLASVYPDFVEWVAWSGNTVQPESFTAPARDKHGDGFTQGVSVESWWRSTAGVAGRYRKDLPSRRTPQPDYQPETLKPLAKMEFVAARLRLDVSAADREDSGANHRFRPTMIRLVGDLRSEPRQYFPRVIAGADAQIGGAPRIVDIDTNFAIPIADDNRIDVYFEVDQGFEPRFVEYRRHARAAMSADRLREQAPSNVLSLQIETGSGRGGPSSFAEILNNGSGDNDALPFDLAMDRLKLEADVQLSGNLFVSGRLHGEVSRYKHSGTGEKAERFKVPDDTRICQIRYQPQRARTLVGRVLNYAARINQYFAVDSTGEKHMLCGYYVIVERNGEPYFELYFTGEKDSITFRGMLDLKYVRAAELSRQPDAVVGLLFLVPHGRQIRSIVNQTGAGGVRGLRLRMRDR